MPATSEKQRKLFALASAVKSGKKVKAGKDAKRIASTLSSGKIREFMKKG